VSLTETSGDRSGRMATTPEALRTKQEVLAHIEAGTGLSEAIIAPEAAPSCLQEMATQSLNPGQLAAATMILAPPDRTVTVQGVAGAGKSTMLAAVAGVTQAEGRSILGLAFQNKMVADLARDAGITAQTAASFLAANERLVAAPDSDDHAAARAALAGTILIVDETSMLSSRQMLGFHRVVEVMGIDKLVLVGDR